MSIPPPAAPHSDDERLLDHAGAIPPGWARGGAATITLEVAPGWPCALLRARAGSVDRLLVAWRRLDASRLDPWERRQQYAGFADEQGRVDVIEVVVRVQMPAELGAPAAADTSATWMRRYRDEGLVRLGAPLPATSAASTLTIAVRIDRARVDLVVDGRIVDSDWPAGPWLAGDAAVAAHPRARVVALRDRALRDDETGWKPVVDPPLAQHWVPAGHNAWAGDAMLCAAGDELSLFWLADRRSGDSKWGCGAHQFARHTTSDLQRWRAHGVVYPVSEPHELSLGTGAVVAHEGELHLFSRHCQERFGPAFEARHPGGMHHARSVGGDAFIKLGPCEVRGSSRTVHDLGSEPGILRDADGLWHAAAAGTRLTSDDLSRWTVADAGFLPPVGWPCTREVPSNECTCWFRWGGWHYVISGRTGFWMSRSLTGPYWGDSPRVARPAWDIYDGLMVPQATVFRGRGILCGWLAQAEGFAGHLVFRELMQRGDGTLAMRRLPELKPAVGAPIAWTLAEGAGVARMGDGLRIDGSRVARAATIAIVAGGYRIRAELTARDCARFGLRLGDAAQGAACELRLDPAAKTARFTSVRAGVDGPEGMPFDGRDFAILAVDGLERRFGLDVLVRRDQRSGTTIVDAQIDGARTLISRRTDAGPVISWFCEGGALEIASLSLDQVAPIASSGSA